MTEENNGYKLMGELPMPKGVTKEYFDRHSSVLVKDLESLILRIDQIETLALQTRFELIEIKMQDALSHQISLQPELHSYFYLNKDGEARIKHFFYMMCDHLVKEKEEIEKRLEVLKALSSNKEE